jgi:hypothetical protein
MWSRRDSWLAIEEMFLLLERAVIYLLLRRIYFSWTKTACESSKTREPTFIGACVEEEMLGSDYGYEMTNCFCS